jgi:hypothetical protein
MGADAVTEVDEDVVADPVVFAATGDFVGEKPAVVHHSGDGAHAGGIGRSTAPVLASDKGSGFCAGRNPLASVVCTASIRTLTTVVAVE